jgi:hypothetical protein
MRLEFAPDEIEQLVRQIIGEVLGAIDWPQGRLALDEAEAAAACGVNKHVLRDLRLSGRLKARKLGRKYVYTRDDLLAALSEIRGGRHAR